MYTGKKGYSALSSVSKSSTSHVPGVNNNVDTTHYKPESKQQYQKQRPYQSWKKTEDADARIKRNKEVVTQSTIHRSPCKRHANVSTVLNTNAMSSNTKIDTGCNVRDATSKYKSSTQHTNVSTIKNPNSSLKNGTLKTSSNVKYTTRKQKPFAIVSTTKNPNTVSELNNKSTFTPSCRGTIGKGAYYHNSSFPSNGGPTAQCHLKEHNTTKNIKERNDAPKSTSTG